METTEQMELAARMRWLVMSAAEIVKQELLSQAGVAEQLGKSVQYVQKKHKEGALYAFKLNRDYIENIGAAFPERQAEISPLLDFIRQGNDMMYPAWQLREKRKPSSGHKVIRPEVKLAREAFKLYAEELAKAAPDHSFVAGKTYEADDRRLYFLFNGTGGCSASALCTHIQKLDHEKPRQRMTSENFKSAWWYHENPFCDFT